MTRGLRKADRARAVEVGAMVWNLIDEDTTEEHIAAFIETGQLDQAPEVMPYNADVMAEIAQKWNT